MGTSTSTLRAAALGAAAAALAACVGSGGGAGGGPVMSHWTPAPPGTTWQVVQRNTGSYGQDAQVTWTREDTRWKGAPAIGLKSSMGTVIMTEPVGGRWVSVVDTGGKPVLSYDPPIGWQFPLKVGKTWSQHERMTLHASSKVVEFDFACKVEAFEKVTVRAGTFDAFRIHCKTPGTDDIYWISPRVGPFVKTQLRRDANSMFGAGTQEQELVSAPAARPNTAAM
ncbi:hypothetical protein [Ramlibacter sp. AN1133]|uniref:hypothetical protein n=1 Tax=Ramlibacter sp. AN1133 TaxID=3133429 RepID=UPI0030C4F1DA